MVTKHQMKKDQSIPINKGNYSMDTEERLQLFEKNRGSDWPDGYKKYRDWIRPLFKST